MSNKLPISKELLQKILKPINRLTESCVLKIQKDGLYSICSSPDNTVVLYAKIKFPIELEEQIRLNLINIKKLICGLECLEDNGEFSLEYSKNNIKCSNTNEEGEKTHFKYHLVDDSVIKECPFNISKLSTIDFDTEFNIENSKIKQIMSGYTFASDVEKIYFYTKDTAIYCEINDRTMQNVDNITIKVCDQYSGLSFDDGIVINMEVFKNLVSYKNDVKVKINNEYKVFVFQNIDDNDVELKYIVSALVK